MFWIKLEVELAYFIYLMLDFRVSQVNNLKYSELTMIINQFVVDVLTALVYYYVFYVICVDVFYVKLTRNIFFDSLNIGIPFH